MVELSTPYVNDGGNGHKAWVYKYMNHIFLTALIGALGLVVALVGKGVNDNLAVVNDKIASVASNVREVKQMTLNHEGKINEVCQDVRTNTLLMGLPYKERKELMVNIQQRVLQLRKDSH